MMYSQFFMRTRLRQQIQLPRENGPAYDPEEPICMSCYLVGLGMTLLGIIFAILYLSNRDDDDFPEENGGVVSAENDFMYMGIAACQITNVTYSIRSGYVIDKGIGRHGMCIERWAYQFRIAESGNLSLGDQNMFSSDLERISCNDKACDDCPDSSLWKTNFLLGDFQSMTNSHALNDYNSSLVECWAPKKINKKMHPFWNCAWQEGCEDQKNCYRSVDPEEDIKDALLAPVLDKRRRVQLTLGLLFLLMTCLFSFLWVLNEEKVSRNVWT